MVLVLSESKMRAAGTKSPCKREAGRSETGREMGWQEWRSERCGAKSQGMRAASRNWKRPRSRFFPGASRRNAALPAHFKLLTCRL